MDIFDPPGVGCCWWPTHKRHTSSCVPLWPGLSIQFIWPSWF